VKINEIVESREPEQLDEKIPSWQDVKQGAGNLAQNIKQGVGAAGQKIGQAYDTTKQKIGQAADVAGRVPGAIQKGIQGYNQSYNDATAAGRDNRYGIEKGIAGATGAANAYQQSYNSRSPKDNEFLIQKYPAAIRSALKGYMDSYNSRSPEENKLLITKLLDQYKQYAPQIKQAIQDIENSKLGRAVGGAKDWIKQKYNAAQGTAAGGENLNIQLQGWNKYLKQMSSAVNMDDPEVYKRELLAYCRKQYPSAFENGKPLVDIDTIDPTASFGGTLNKNSPDNYIMKMFNAAMARRSAQAATGATASKLSQYGFPKKDLDIDIKGNDYHFDSASKTWLDSNNQPITDKQDVQTLNASAYYAANPQAAQQQQAQQPGQKDADDTPQDTEQHDLAPGVSIISQEPLIVRYKGTDFGLDDRGEWISMKGSKIPHESFKAFLDKQAGFKE